MKPAQDDLGLARWLLDDDTARWSARYLEQLAAGRPVPA